MRILAIIGILPAGCTLFFGVFWAAFEFWRRHRWLTYVMIVGTLVALAVAVVRFDDVVLAPRVAVQTWVAVIGWVLIALACRLGWVADRQIGLRVRSFAPFFDDQGRIELQTSGAYEVVRHPIYSAGVGFQVGIFLVTGYLAVLAAAAVMFAGALWFTRQEEKRLVALLDDPSEYERYRAEVPALIPWPRRRD